MGPLVPGHIKELVVLLTPLSIQAQVAVHSAAKKEVCRAGLSCIRQPVHSQLEVYADPSSFALFTYCAVCIQARGLGPTPARLHARTSTSISPYSFFPERDIPSRCHEGEFTKRVELIRDRTLN